MTTSITRFTVLAGSIVPAALAAAGPLNPPAGPVTSTYKTLSEVEPRIAVNATNTPGDSVALFVISSPGSYYLTGNISGVSGKKGIKIQANNVSLDLNGFALMGNGVGDDAIYSLNSNISNLTVRNGLIRDWIKEGVDAYNSTSCRIEGVQVENSVNGYGIITGPNSVITGCTIRGSAAGVVTSTGAVVRDCTAIGNLVGFAMGTGTTVTGCTAQDSTAGYGFQTGTGCTLSQCTSNHNLGTTGYGFDLGSGNTVIGCSAYNNDLDGFHTQSGATNVLINGCNSFTNRGNGIKTENGVGFTLSGNNCSRNNLNGIQVSGSSTVISNTCEDNGTLVSASTSGIYATFGYNRIDGNTLIGSTYGIAVASGQISNLVIRNTVTLCTTPYSLPAGVAYGNIDFLGSGVFTEPSSFANIKY
jgi:parallel beta-helix repeat protein